ncbi:MAG: glycosyl hydrolase 115 family protein [Muribaculaceae bacterium]|nr:glycosyl hydrolase 115 family protein [Muribaculaceae bacterium]
MHFRLYLLSLISLSSLFFPFSLPAMVWYDGNNPVSFYFSENCDPVVTVAAGMFAADMEAVTGQLGRRVDRDNAIIRIYQLDASSDSEIKDARKAGINIKALSNLTDGFAIREADGVIHIAGANGRGAAYGLLEMSRKAGVSPWIWWGDVVPAAKDSLTIEDGFTDMQGASVERRGIFINDEDWSLRPWSHLNFEPSDKTEIGSSTYRKIFELLLRLRGNTLWPAMHEGTTAFFLVEGAKQQADSCGIIIGTSHCEPMLRNNVGEWDTSKRGRFNYKTNKDEVHRYWKERLQQVKDSKGGNIFTIGMRGIHDSSMEGYKTVEEKFEGLQQVIDDQQVLIAENIGDPSLQDQVFVPYKEVLELYEMGLNVPEYVTLMWCDDNHGYLTRLSNEKEQQRSGGGGVYYHLSYWGQPHDYLWLTTTQPGLIFHQMRQAYDNNVRKLWIANVHDPKVAGYDLELFLDLAWDINSIDASSLRSHYKAWLTRQFGEKAAELIFPVMHDFYRLCGERRPEFMGWSQVEKDRNLYERRLSPVRSTEFNPNEFGDELNRYVEEFDKASYVVDYATKFVDPSLYDAYYAAVIYPVCVSAAHARSILKAQEARTLASGRNATVDRAALEERIRDACAQSQRAYQQVRKLTEYYNNVVSDGKWKWSMDMRPRDLPVFFAPSLPLVLTEQEMLRYPTPDVRNPNPPLPGNTVVANADSYSLVRGKATPIGMLGHSMNAVSLGKGSSLTYDFEIAEESDGVIRVALIPTHAIDGEDVRFSISIDGSNPVIFSLKEPFRSEQWKENVMRGQTIRTVAVSLKAGKHNLEIKALDENIVVDQWMWDPDPNRKFYLFPISS